MAGNTGKAPYSRNLGGGRVVDKIKKDAGKVWGVRDIPLRFDWVKDSKEKLARRRVKNDTVEKIGGDSGFGWIVWGMGELGDSFEKYYIERDEETGNLSCSCQGHAHGDARGFCSHQFAVALWEYDRDPYPCIVRDRDIKVQEIQFKSNSEANMGAYDHEQEMREIIEEITDGPISEEFVSSPPIPEVYRIDPWGVEGWVSWTTERMVDEKVLDQAVVQVEDGNVSLAVRLAEPELANKEEIKESGWYDYSKRPEILDLEQVEPGRYSLPEKFTKIRHNQLIGLKQVIGQWHDRKKFIMVDAPTGCLSASTWIKYAIYDSKGKRYSHRGSSIERLSKRFHRVKDSRQRGRDPIIPDNHDLRVASVYPDGRIRMNKILDVIYNGIKECFRVETCNGFIEATANHPFLTSEGYVKLSDLKVGDMVLVHRNAIRKGREKRKPRNYLFVKSHPVAGVKMVNGCRYHRLAKSRAVVEANMNGMSLEEYILALNGDNQIAMSFLTRDFDVHHIDEDSTNDELSNLCVLSKKDHSKIHEDRDKLKILRIPVEEKILSITFCGAEDVYDLTMQDVPNFSANDFFVHNSGKTVLGIMASMEITGFSSGGSIAQGLYICTDRALQDQFWGDFEFCLWSAILKGRRNYPTANFPSRYQEDSPNLTPWDREQIISAEDCEYSGKKHCVYCDPKNYCHDTDSGNRGAPCLGRCPYKQAVKKLVNSEIGCMNTSYLIRACSGASWGQFAKKKVLIVDEADVLESTIMGYVEISVNEFSLKRMGIGRPKKKTVPSAWIEWAEEALYKAGYIVTHRGKQLDDPQNKVLFLEDEKLFGNEKLIKRDLNKWENLCNQLQLMIKSLKTGKDPWVYDCKSEVDTEAERGPVVFKPVVIGSFCEELLWKHFDFVMLMSATLISPFQMAEDLGMPVGKVGAVNLPSSFDPARSPVYICPVADNSFKHQAESFPILIDAIVDAINSRPGVRVLIHAVSYIQSEKITQELKRRIKGRVILTHERGVQSKNKAKGEYMVRPGCVLISPSMARGENLSDDLLRFQIIIKMPFGNLGDKQVKQRLYGTSGGKQWYLINTIRETVQMEGRLMRHEMDWGETLILDAKFTSVWGEGENFFPEYFKRRMIFVSPGNLSAMLRQGFGAQFIK